MGSRQVLPPIRTFTPAPDGQRQLESHRRATSSPGAHNLSFGFVPIQPASEGPTAAAAGAVVADDAKPPILPPSQRPKSPIERVPSPANVASVSSDTALHSPSGRSFPARKLRHFFGLSAESPGIVVLLGLVAAFLFLALILKNNQASLSAALVDAREHLRASFKGPAARPKRFSLRVKCGSDSLPNGPIGSSEGCLVIAPACSETWVAVLEAGEERVIDGLCRDEAAGIALVTQRCDGTCKEVKPDPATKPVDDWTGPTKEFVIESIGAKGVSAGSLYDPWTRVALPESAPGTLVSFPAGQLELPGPKSGKQAKKPKGKQKNVKQDNSSATILRFPVLGSRSVIGESVPFSTLQSKNMSGWMEELWAVGGFRHLFEGICDLRSSELGCGGQNDGISFPVRKWHMNVYALERSNYENSGDIFENAMSWLTWRWIYLSFAAVLIALIVYSLRPFFERRSPGRLAKLKSMTFVEHDIARVQQEVKLASRQ